jgi:hypothetical protein
VARKLNRIAETEKGKDNLAIVSTNNHYAGFGEGTANIFRKIIGLEEVTWQDKKVPLTEEDNVAPTGTKQKCICMWKDILNSTVNFEGTND